MDAPAAAARFLEAPDPAAFDETARSVFAFQYAHVPPYRRLCEHRGVHPEAVTDWREIPPVPTAAFQHVRLTSGDPVRIFRTSGTSETRRGEHALPDLGLYRRSWKGPFCAAVLPDRRRMAMVSLVPSEAELPDSSLAFMIARAAETLAEGPVLEAMSPRTGLDFDALRAGFETAAARGEPLLLLGTAFAFVHLLDRCEREGIAFVLPEGSRIMDTGGFKGRSREVARGELLAAYRERLGIPETHVVSEYGMTELCSQFYEPVLADRISGNRAADGGRVFVGPPWVRTRVLDPETLAELRPGEPGLLCHFDLANAWTVSAVLTEDLGVAAGRGFRVLGRARGAELRGCSLAAEAILER